MDKIAEVFELNGKIHAVDDHGFRNRQHGRGKVEDARDAFIDQLVGDGLSGNGRDREDGHTHTSIVDHASQMFHSVQWNGQRLVPGASDVGIKSSHDFKTFLFESPIAEEGRPEIAHPDEDDRLQAVGAEQIGNHLRQLVHVVAETPGAELAEIGQVLAELGWLHSGRHRQGLAADRLQAVTFQAVKAPKVEGKTVDRLPGDFRST